MEPVVDPTRREVSTDRTVDATVDVRIYAGYRGDVPAGVGHHVRKAVRLQMGPNGLAHVGPDGEEDALAFVVAGAIGVRFSEVAGSDGPVDR